MIPAVATEEFLPLAMLDIPSRECLDLPEFLM
jgi:hypothetical protein